MSTKQIQNRLMSPDSVTGSNSRDPLTSGPLLRETLTSAPLSRQSIFKDSKRYFFQGIFKIWLAANLPTWDKDGCYFNMDVI